MVFFYLLLAAVLGFIICKALSSGKYTWSSDEVPESVEETSSASRKNDLLGFKLGTRIFSSEDWRLVKAEAPRQVARWFDRERKALAIEWLRHVRMSVRDIVREHRRAARRSQALKPAEELELAFQYWTFEVLGEFLYWLIYLRGPTELRFMLERLFDGKTKLCRIVERALEENGRSVQVVKN